MAFAFLVAVYRAAGMVSKGAVQLRRKTHATLKESVPRRAQQQLSSYDGGVRLGPCDHDVTDTS